MTRQSCECQVGNPGSGKCTGRVHHYMRAILGQGAVGYVGHIFERRAYPDFDSLAQCKQYVREYVPLHLTQIEAGLLEAAKAMPLALPLDRPIRVLDIGGGPGTVALALERLTASGKLGGCFVVDVIEPSAPFCRMLNIAKMSLCDGSVSIGEISQHDFLDYWFASKGKRLDYDWIVSANVMSPLSLAWERRVGMEDEVRKTSPCSLERLGGVARDAWSTHDLGLLFWHILKNFTREGLGAITLIEGGCRTYINEPRDYMRQLASFEGLQKIAGSYSTRRAGRMPPCNFYETKYGHDMPNLIMLTMKAVA